MRVVLKGIDSAKKRLANGTFKTYFYAWRGGPRLDGEPGSPDFIAAYNRAVSERPSDQQGSKGVVLESIIDAYLDSQDFLTKSARTQSDYRKQAKIIVAEFGDLPLTALPDKRARGKFLDWRDRLAKKSPRQADYAWTVLALILSWAKGRGRIDTNPCERGGRLYDVSRADKIWREPEEKALLAVASAPLALAYHLAVWTGQRQGDLLRLTWSAYDGGYIKLRQSKTGVYVVVPVAEPLKRVLDAMKRTAVTIMTTQRGIPWTPDGFRVSWGKAVAKAKIEGLTFHDLRGTAVTRLAIAGCTVPEIASITGHSAADVQSILDKHYLHRDIALAENAIRKLERSQKKAEGGSETNCNPLMGLRAKTPN